VPLLLTLRVWAWRARPLLALVLLALLALAAAHAVAPDAPAPAVLVAATDLAAGDVLTGDDLRAVPLDPAPVGAPTDPAAVVGRALAVAVPAGLPLVPELLDGERFTRDPPAGTVVVPLELDEAAVLVAGDRVDVLAVGCPEHPAALARRALVVQAAEPTGSGGVGPVLVAVTRAEVSEISEVRAVCQLGAALVE